MKIVGFVIGAVLGLNLDQLFGFFQSGSREDIGFS
jgi:hypothetical protein